ncbi:MAG TPA: hypothetical protein EYP39_08830 [Ghiorsea sp.]|nr:hypothetical protein [Ghiorsea sp.]
MASQDNHYDTLQISTHATTADIINAYRDIKLIFQENSLAAYSLYSAEEIATINQQIEEAYVILSNSQTRLSYDITLHIHDVERAEKEVSHHMPIESNNLQSAETTPVPSEVSGKVLQSIRESHAITLLQIAEKTNISLAHLKAIEANQSSAFPGVFYLKSYLKQYASCIGLEPCLTWEKYLKNLKD